MVCGDVWTGSERVLCTELWLRLGMLLLPPGLANHRFCGEQTQSVGCKARPSVPGVYNHIRITGWFGLEGT